MKGQKVRIQRERWNDEGRGKVEKYEEDVTVMDKYKLPGGETVYLGKGEDGKAVAFSPRNILLFLTVLILICLTAF